MLGRAARRWRLGARGQQGYGKEEAGAERGAVPVDGRLSGRDGHPAGNGAVRSGAPWRRTRARRRHGGAARRRSPWCGAAGRAAARGGAARRRAPHAERLAALQTRRRSMWRREVRGRERGRSASTAVSRPSLRPMIPYPFARFPRPECPTGPERRQGCGTAVSRTVSKSVPRTVGLRPERPGNRAVRGRRRTVRPPRGGRTPRTPPDLPDSPDLRMGSEARGPAAPVAYAARGGPLSGVDHGTPAPASRTE